MKIWELDCDVENYESLSWGDNEFEIDLDFIQSFNGTPKEKDWIPIELKRMRDEMDFDMEFGNTTHLSAHIPVFDKKAVDIMKDYLSGNAEILPIFCEGREFFAINVIRVLDCIDYEAAEYRKFTNGRIMVFTKYAFIEEKINNVHLFKIKDKPLWNPFISDEFRNRILESDLKGFKFELVWDSEA